MTGDTPRHPAGDAPRFTSGDTLRFTHAGTVYVGITLHGQDGSVSKTHLLLRGDTGIFCIPDQTASISIRYYTLQADDDTATGSFVVYEKDRLTPVRGAYLDAFFGDHPDSLFALELHYHPDDYLAYAYYFNVVSMLDTDAVRRIAPLLSRLDSLGAARHSKLRSARTPGLQAAYTPGLLAALCVGYAKTGRLDTARRYLSDLFREYPQTQETAFAYSLYDYEYYKASGRDEDPLVSGALRALFLRYPWARVSTDPNVLYRMGQDTSVPLSAIEAAYEPLYRDDKVPYYAFAALPQVYRERGQRLDSARSLLLAALRSYEDGSVQHQFRLTARHYKSYVPGLLLELGRLDLLQGDPPAALLHASAGLDILHGSNTEGNFRADLLKVRSEAYRALGNEAMAAESGDVRDAAPVFGGVDLSGDTVRLSALRGRVVVLNFWGTGCGPCVAEMPELNKLVAEYPDVVFLGLTADEPSRLPAFLRQHPYRYRVVCVPPGTFSAFQVEGIPVHMVIDRAGAVVSRSVGARADIVSFLEGAIAQARH